MTQVTRACAVCGSTETNSWFRPPRSPGPVVQCTVCGFVYVNPIEQLRALIEDGPVVGGEDRLRQSADLADLKGRWEEPLIADYLSELEPKQANARDALARIERWRPHRGRVLDVGCFCGVFLSVAQRRGWECIGLEPLVGPAIYARGQFGLPVINGVLRPETFPPESLDVVTAFQVFEHLIHPEQEIEKIRPMLKPGGLLVIEVPNIATPLVQLLRTRHRHFVQDHVSFFSVKTLRRLLEAQGFIIREFYYPARVLSLRHLLWWLGVRALGARLPDSVKGRVLKIGIRDIIAVIAEKV